MEAVSPDLIVKFNEVNSETGEQSLSVSRRPSPDIRWEKTLSMDYNLSWSLFRNRINGNFSYYYKKTNRPDSSTKRGFGEWGFIDLCKSRGFGELGMGYVLVFRTS